MTTYLPVTSTRSTSCVTVPGKGLSQLDKSLLLHAADAYGHVLEPGDYTWAEFAAALAASYSIAEPHNRAVFDAMLRAHAIDKANLPPAAAIDAPLHVPAPEPAPYKKPKPTKARPFVFEGRWRNGGPLVVARCKTMEDARDAARNFFNNHTTGSIKGGYIHELDGTTHIFLANGDYLCTVPAEVPA